AERQLRDPPAHEPLALLRAADGPGRGRAEAAIRVLLDGRGVLGPPLEVLVVDQLRAADARRRGAHVPEHPRVPELSGPDLVHELRALEVEPHAHGPGGRGRSDGLVALPALPATATTRRRRGVRAPRQRSLNARSRAHAGVLALPLRPRS